MNSTYLPRILLVGDRYLSEDAALALGGVVVVLAEPGGGKSSLLDSLSRKLGVSRNRASLFRHSEPALVQALVIDGLDEVAKIDQSAVDALMVKAAESRATVVVFSSRSSEWNDTRTQTLKDCFGDRVHIARLRPFDEAEQRTLFNIHLPEEDFDHFHNEARRFELHVLLANPQFLTLFADAYIESGRVFLSKQQIFSSAIKRLAAENSSRRPLITRPTSEVIVGFAQEVFAKILLSGAAGVSLSESASTRDYPYLHGLTRRPPSEIAFLADTKLLKVADGDFFEPVHRIVAEYCAAEYLVRRIADAGDRTSLKRCLALIAPQGTVREELRGLLGWMAARGPLEVQTAAIDIDPYGVLANGDPSQLHDQSKRLLVRKLGELAEIDPYFRGGDNWRSFSCAGFFTSQVIEEIRILFRQNGGQQLRDLLLELLVGSDAVEVLLEDLTLLLHDDTKSFNTRHLAMDCLMGVESRDHRSDFLRLLEGADSDALRLASRFVRHMGVAHFSRDAVLQLFRLLAGLTRSGQSIRVRTVGSTYFIGTLVKTLSGPDVRWLLDAITSEITCTCVPKHSWRCECRLGISKIVGSLLDRYVEVTDDELSPETMWAWIKDLRFKERASNPQSPSVALIQSNAAFRQSIQRLGLGTLDDREKIWETRIGAFEQGHAGVGFHSEDFEVLLDHAFETDNTVLWRSFLVMPSIYHRQEWRDQQRRHARAQSQLKPAFAKAWAAQNHGGRERRREEKDGRSHAQARYRRRQKTIREINLAHLKENRESIESGRDLWWITVFAEQYLFESDKRDEIMDDPELPARALRNFLSTYSGPIPSLGELVEAKWQTLSRVCIAACLAHFKNEATLSGVDLRILKVVRASAWPVGNADDYLVFEKELNAVLFSYAGANEDFIRSLVEPQLLLHGDVPTDASWLGHRIEFAGLGSKLAIEWLVRFPAMPYGAMTTLFQIALTEGNLERVRSLILMRSCEYCALWPDTTADGDLEAKREFWLLCHFFFFKEHNTVFWSYLGAKPANIFLFSNKAGIFASEKPAGWPALGAEKVHLILSTFIEAWPPVDLPNGFGSDSPQSEKAFRFLANLLPAMDRSPSQASLDVLDRIVGDNRFAVFRDTALSLKAEQTRALSLRDFQAPLPEDIVTYLDRGDIASVEDLRALLVEQLQEIQTWIRGAPTDPLSVFYPSGKRVGENEATKRIVEFLDQRFKALNLSVNIEHHMANSKRCDITIDNTIGGRQRLLVVEAKGQWNTELYSAASAQLHQRYAIHPSAEHQGVLLVYWFGHDVDVAGSKTSGITNAALLRTSILDQMPADLQKAIDVIVLDLER